MAESYITQCPHCGTTFKVTTQHLEAANGSVRCGACLRVFSARNHLVPETPKRAATSADMRRPSGSNREFDSLGAGNVVSPSFSQPTDAPQFEEDDDSDFLFIDDAHTSVDEDDDDIIFEDDPESDLLDDSFPGKPDEGLGELSDEFQKIGSSSGFNPPPKHEDDELVDSSADDEAWARKMLEEMEHGPGKSDLNNISANSLSLEEKPGAEPVKKPVKAKKPKPKVEAIPEAKLPEQHFSALDDDFLSADFGPASSVSQREPAASRLVEAIDTDPLDLDFSEPRGSAKTVVYALLSVLLILVAVAQVAWVKFDILAKTDQWRPYYATACNILGCQLPAQVNIQLIKTGNVIVRKHPKNPNGLIVDAILVNQAPFQQPYPDIILSFTDINGKAVADAAFSPEQYLSGEAAGAQIMPSGTPIHIAIAISNPGDKAVNYTVSFRESASKK